MRRAATDDSFREALLRLREKKKMSREELGQRAGTSRQAIFWLESGRRSPSWEMVKALAKALGVKVEAFC
jgi:transcriptional regulator with XRE-family HTH domain